MSVYSVAIAYVLFQGGVASSQTDLRLVESRRPISRRLGACPLQSLLTFNTDPIWTAQICSSGGFDSLDVVHLATRCPTLRNSRKTFCGLHHNCPPKMQNSIDNSVKRNLSLTFCKKGPPGCGIRSMWSGIPQPSNGSLPVL